MGLVLGLGVEQRYGIVNKAVSEPAGATPKAAVRSPRREDRV